MYEQPKIKTIEALESLHVNHLPLVLRYTFSSLLVAMSIIIGFLLDEASIYTPVIIFIPGIFIAAFILNRGSGFLATILSSLAAWYFFFPHFWSFSLQNMTQLIGLAVFFIIGLTLAMVIEALHMAIHELVRKKNLLESIVEGSPDPIFVRNKDGRYVLVNSGMARNMSLEKADIEGKTCEMVFPADQAAGFNRRSRQVMQSGQPFTFEEVIGQEYGETATYMTTYAPWYDFKGHVTGIIGVSRNIENLKRAREELKLSDEQKTLLLRDINHRIKNQLQSIVGNLQLRMLHSEDPVVREALESAINQLFILTRIFDRLHLHGKETIVRSQEFIEGLAFDLRQSTVNSPQSLHIDIDDCTLDLNLAISIGLIINELVTNAVKHAFPEGRKGKILVCFYCEEDGGYFLQVSDDGIGIQDSAREGSGRDLVESFAIQHKGRVEWNGDPGTTVKMWFPKPA